MNSSAEKWKSPWQDRKSGIWKACKSRVIKIINWGLDLMAHNCNLSYSRGINRRITVKTGQGKKKTGDPIKKYLKQKGLLVWLK
jgi:hypothetical protein